MLLDQVQDASSTNTAKSSEVHPESIEESLLFSKQHKNLLTRLVDIKACNKVKQIYIMKWLIKYYSTWFKDKLTSMRPLMTHGNEFNGEIKLLNKARQVKTWEKKKTIQVSGLWRIFFYIFEIRCYRKRFKSTVAASSWWPISA